MPDENTLLHVKNLTTIFETFEGRIVAVDDVSFSVNRMEIVGIVGESGCGKSATALSIMRLIPNPPGKIEKGEVIFENRNLLHLSEKEMRKIRGNKISMIFQEPMTSLNPVFTVGNQIAEAIELHQNLKKKQALNKTIEILEKVGIPNPEINIKKYPHELSGGMKQRVMIAMALSCQPSLLIADEPTTALDVTIQAQILSLMLDVRERFSTAILLITHDLGVIAETAERVIVMYAGRILEQAPVEKLFLNPAHPYSEGLLQSLPQIKISYKKEKFSTIPGNVPDLLDLPSGCKFHPRCNKKMAICEREEPPFFPISLGHQSRCWLHS